MTKLTVDGYFKKFAPLYILQILAKHTDGDHTLTYEEIREKLQDDGFEMERKAISRYAEDLKEIGFNIHGVGERDENGKKNKTKRGIWLEKSLSDENLQLLIDSVLYSKYISTTEAEELIKKIRDMGSATFQAKNKGIAKLSSVYHAREAGFFKELNVIQQAIAQEKKLSFSYGKYKESNGKFEIVEKNNIVSPYHLVFSNGKYYLIGYHEDKGEIWHFRVDKIYRAKIENLPAKPIRDTELKGITIGEYMLQHPFLFTGDAETVTFKVQSDQIGHVIDTFGERFTVRAHDKLTTTLSLLCNENDAYYWALQFSGIVEVLEPQKLRERLRVAAEEMAMRYMNSETDRYEEALGQVDRRRGILELQGIDLQGRTKHQKLNVRDLKLSDNRLEDIAFLQNYEYLTRVDLRNNPISDLSPLAHCKRVTILCIKNLAIKDLSALADMKSLRCLDLEGCEGVDGSAIYQMEALEALRIRGCVKNLDLDELKQQRPNLEITLKEGHGWRYPVGSVCQHYPLNVLKEAFGYRCTLRGDKEEAALAVDKMLLKLPQEERDIAELVYKENLGEAEISDILAISVDEIARRTHSLVKKIRHKSYKNGLETYVEKEDLNKNYSLKDFR